ncbi:uncharacterized protein LOC124155549 [Ischnura elegans]|uniref:uncharacterized protein LOC124155549 n=1 Tax=Ischnura elegans TaxID=197161 RepID=UPI001ED887E6|nr:uncharacterized protein LOC124155549 [Ischnura elegans]XP_046385431.1 uncharacterized protein LOC124155549 [Ischnura elegans]XP_046385440.1 uncharacterized protein LOC124155549 [Ischnura elegans]XP_046385450.1 uncharacterized protein LOC124155549 [Ischnura elegans]
MSVTPYLRIPITDLTGCALNQQHHGRCADIEMKMMDCLEAYGRDRGKVKCEDLIADFNECSTRRKQFDRIMRMRYERHLQYLKKERPEHYEPAPRIDSY